MRTIASHVAMRSVALRRALASPPLRRLQLASLAHNTVEYAVIVALAVYAFDRGGAAAVGLITIVRTFPALLSGPVLSVAADRSSRSAVLTTGFAARAVTTGALAVAAGLESAAVAIYVLAAVDAMVASAFYPAYSALVPDLARSSSELATANAMASATENLGTILGPAAAAALLITGGPSAVFVAAAIIVAGGAVASSSLRSERRSLADRGHTASVVADLGAGLAAVRRNRGARAVMGSWALESVLIGMSEVFLVVIAFDLIGWGDSGVGWLNAVLGVGGLAGSIAMATLARHRPFGRYLAFGLAASGIAVVSAAAPLAAVILVAHVVLGVAAAQVDVAAMTLLQRTVPEDELGRVFGLFEGIYWGALGLGAAAASWTVVTFGLQAALVATGVIAAVLAVLLLPRLAKVDSAVDVPEERLALLRHVPIFAALPVPTQERLARRMAPRSVAAGADIIREGATDGTIYVVESGELVVHRSGTNVATLRRRDVFGEIAALRGVRRTATVTALSDVTLLRLDGAAFAQAVAGHAGATANTDSLVDRRIGQLRRIRSRTGR